MTAQHNADHILGFWLHELTPKDWYVANDDVDAAIRQQFMTTWQAARDGGLREWCETANGALAYLVVCDQFPRNMFRGHRDAFATDPQSVAAAQDAITAGLDVQISGPAQQFFYLPFMHAEDIALQDRSVALFAERMETSDNLDHAKAHRNVIAQFGRFPYRNAALGRRTTPQEQVFLDAGGYGAAIRAVQTGEA